MHKDTVVIIRNAGHAQLNISGITNSNINSFGTGYPGGTTLLNPNDSLSLGITFHPPANMIHYSDSVIIASNSATPGKIHLAGHTALHVNNNEARERFELYPVPVTGDHLYVKTSTPWPRNILVEIVKTSGEIVCSEIQHPTDDQPLKINTGSLKDGAYCLRINTVSLFFVILRKMN
jgi:hypothetical protein